MARHTTRVADSAHTMRAGGRTAAAGGRTAAADPAVVASVEACLRAHIGAAGEGAHLLQVCMQDHSASAPTPHLHLQMHFSDATRSAWVQHNGATLGALREAIALVIGQRDQLIRLHVHAAARRKRTARECARTMPCHTLTVEEAELIDDPTCPICLEDLVAGDSLMVVPCAGLHKGHAHCLRRWLEHESCTCPTCRHELPVDGAKSVDGARGKKIAELRELASREIWRLRSQALACGDPPGGEICACSSKRRPAPISTRPDATCARAQVDATLHRDVGLGGITVNILDASAPPSPAHSIAYSVASSSSIAYSVACSSSIAYSVASSSSAPAGAATPADTLPGPVGAVRRWLRDRLRGSRNEKEHTAATGSSKPG